MFHKAREQGLISIHYITVCRVGLRRIFKNIYHASVCWESLRQRLINIYHATVSWAEACAEHLSTFTRHSMLCGPWPKIYQNLPLCSILKGPRPRIYKYSQSFCMKSRHATKDWSTFTTSHYTERSHNRGFFNIHNVPVCGAGIRLKIYQHLLLNSILSGPRPRIYEHSQRFSIAQHNWNGMRLRIYQHSPCHVILSRSAPKDW